MSRYDLTDFEWRVIEPLLPNKRRDTSNILPGTTGRGVHVSVGSFVSF
jgi:transposase